MRVSKRLRCVSMHTVHMYKYLCVETQSVGQLLVVMEHDIIQSKGHLSKSYTYIMKVSLLRAFIPTVCYFVKGWTLSAQLLVRVDVHCT